MSDIEIENKQDNGTSMYVHQVEFQTLLSILQRVTNVNKLFTYTMPNKAEKYAGDGFDLISTLNNFIDGDEDWRIQKENNVSLKVQGDKITIGNTLITGTKLVMCLPRINSIIIIPDENCLINGVKDLTKIIQLTNCIAIMPLLVRLSDEPIEGEEGKYNLGMTMEIIVPRTSEQKEEKPTE